MNQPHILIVDSDPTAALVTQRGLQRIYEHAAEVEIAASPDAARQRCLDDRIDLLIVDPAPETGAAPALVKALHTECPDLPVVVLTAYDTPRLRAQMQKLAVRGYLAKPIELSDLGAVVRRVANLSPEAPGMESSVAPIV